MISKLSAFCLASALTVTALPASAQEASSDANPTISIALSWVFGKGAAFGVKAFSTDREGDAALTLGIDYLFNDQSWRPNIGAAYIDNNAFIDLNLGFGNGGTDFGVGIGPIDSSQDSAPLLPPIIENSPED
ncbi:hypothetical protein [Actibacterium pelagium]|uniref:Outer membrane protein beta-barrel domain-containing protein n=1 Tax=Actibacterium pelagium TaxID=2029103 RepID=A0A917EIN8_9RHOB|nr:hypothetical protein [Actibacterium pelagium]GGE39714.1 hypothetical protein GCM10011517_04290 [Actibacterium pelagium]